MSDDGIYFGPGTTPEKVAERVERAQRESLDRPRRTAASTSQREAFFQRIAEDIKRAEAGS